MGDAHHMLDRGFYPPATADRLLRVKPGTVGRWLDSSRGPLPRLGPAGGDAVTWGEFASARLLCEYRHHKAGVSKMRGTVLKLRDVFGAAYPLAAARPFADEDGLGLVMQAQEETRLNPELWLAIRAGETILPAPAVRRFNRRVDKDGHMVRRVCLTPHVVIDPEYSSGSPTIKGRRLRVDAVAGAVTSGQSPQEVAQMCDIPVQAVEDALAYADIA